MKLNFEYITQTDDVYVNVVCPTLEVNWFMKFNYTKFFERYGKYPSFNLDMLKEDLADTYMNILCLPFDRETVIKDMKVTITSYAVINVNL